MKTLNRVDPIRPKILKAIRNVCVSAFASSVIVFAVVSITYQSSDQWQSSRAPTEVFAEPQNATLTTNAYVLRTGVDTNTAPLARTDGSHLFVKEATLEGYREERPNLKSDRPAAVKVVNCSDPGVLMAIQSFNLRTFTGLEFLEYQTPVQGTRANECDVAWRFTSKLEKSKWRKYRDFRRYTMGYNEDFSYTVIRSGRWHSGSNALSSRNRARANVNIRNPEMDTVVQDDEIKDKMGLESRFREGRYLYYSRGGDYCKNMNQYTWSLLCGLGEAMYLNRTFVMDLSMCLASSDTQGDNGVEGKDFRFYFDFEHLKEAASVVDDVEFIRDWKRWDKQHKSKISCRKIINHKVTPIQLRREKSTILWRQFDAPEPENYWYRVCDGPASKYVKRPWDALWTSKTVKNIATEIISSMGSDFDAIHVVRGEKAMNRELWPNLDADTSPDALLAKLQGEIPAWRHLYIATNEHSYHFFDKLRSQYYVHLLDDYCYLWGNTSEWYNETTRLNGGRPAEFDGYMRVAVDNEVLYRSKTRVETFYNLTRDCKDGINKC
ncbi:uncharacterized protein LOC127239457 [Andrographis paniculata]|uniref:uncharacterized protein LOC127239457 n=1 Tax=Andrographis paniculata TaxID=175694 RepID=UPI0021E76BEB|nr:uncharacterized protein LOC127239457 [Andrographis paniculata]